MFRLQKTISLQKSKEKYLHVNPFDPRTIENQEVPISQITRPCSRALARQQC